MSNTLTSPATRPRLGRPPLIAPAPNLSSYNVTASDGRRYRLIPTGVRHLPTPPGQPVQKCVTFQYRRIDEHGKLIKRIRISKKNRLRLKRAVAEASRA
jgi:hypothetical protein